MNMDPFTLSFLSALLANVTPKFIAGAGRKLQKSIQGTEKERAIKRCLQNGIVAMVAASAGNTETEQDLLEDIFSDFFNDDHVIRELAALLKGNAPDREELQFLFEEAGYIPEQLPGLEFRQAIGVFEAAFIATAAEEESLREIVKTNILIEQLQLQRQMMEVMRELANSLSDIRLETLKLSEGKLTGSSISGKTIVYQLPAFAPPPRHIDGEDLYLKTLIGLCDPLDLTLMHESRRHLPGHGEDTAVKISDVFTRLYLLNRTRTSKQDVAEALWGKETEMPPKPSAESEERFPIQAVEAVAASKRLIILGQPGGGKSSLVNHLTVELARRRSGLPVEPDKIPGWAEEESPLPVRIILRRFAAWLPGNIPLVKAGLVWEYLEEQLKQFGCPKFFDSLQHWLVNQGGIIFFDGLDEVSVSDEQNKRSIILKAIEEFANPLENCRVIITCREYAYKQGETWRLPGKIFPVVELSLFEAEQMKDFCNTWYRVVGPQKGWQKEQCQREGENLFNAIQNSAHLQELAQYPLLLTLMAEVHGSEGRLPEDRADLYERAVDLLLVHWESRIVRETVSGREVKEGLLTELGVNRKILREALELVAFTAHERQEKEAQRSERVADIPREDLRDILEEELGGIDKAQKAINYIQDRAGLLLARDNRTYTFPHRTFQEYLAAAYIAKQSNFVTMLSERLQRDFSWWQEVFLLTAGYLKRAPLNISNLVNGILPHRPRKDRISPPENDLAILAARALKETRFREHVRKEKVSKSSLYGKTYDHIQRWLGSGMISDRRLKAPQRVAAGNALGDMGDPRDPVTAVDGMEFCYVPGGSFRMGSEVYDEEKPPHLNETLRSPYWIGRYPVTVAQFREYVKETAEKPGEPDSLRGIDNHPVVRVSWYEAIKFCDWLNARWHSAGILREEWIVTLPGEAQWEKAARGGREILQKLIIAPVHKLPRQPKAEPQKNSLPQRVYPWGDQPDTNLMNYNDTGIGSTSPVGCFPAGASPYGCEEMSGNVWEWTRSLWGKNIEKPDYKYPYDANDGREDLGASGEVRRVVRGGSFGYDRYDVRCSIRYRFSPDDRYNLIGFRVVLSPYL